MKRLATFLHEYKLFSAAIAGAVVGLICELAGWHTAAHWVLGTVALAEVVPLVWGMWEDLRSGTYGVDILAATAIVTSVVMHQYWAAIVIVLMLTGGESLEDYAEHRARTELDALLSRAPATAHVLRGRKTIDVKASEVREGDKLAVRPGEIVPADAVIIDGTASFDESSITGESLPQAKEAGASIVSGSVNLDGAITARATASAANSQYEQIIKLVQNAQRSQAPFVRLADRYAVPFTIISFAIAIGAAVLGHHAIRFLEVLVVATPCPLILAAPIAIISGMSRSAKHGIIIKNGSALERLALARTFAFDKTGTLTRGSLEVDSVRAYGKRGKKEVLALAAGLEQHSNHVVAQAIAAEAQRLRVALARPKQVREVAGKGVTGTLRGDTVVLGRAALLRERGVTLPETFDETSVRQTSVFVAVGGELAGVITLKDEIRPESKATIKHLRDLGVKHIMMVTGDNRVTAAAIAKQLGFKQVTAEALPGDKLRAIENAPERPVAFVGDGVNDAPVLTASDVGIALGARGSAAASESADVVVMLDDLERVALGVKIAKRTFFIARQSILVGIAMSIGLMFVYATGRFSPLSGAIVQELVDVVVIFNALRAHGRPAKAPVQA